MQLCSKKMTVLSAREIEGLFWRKYGERCYVADTLWHGDFMNDCYKHLNIDDTLWDLACDLELVEDYEDDDLSHIDFTAIPSDTPEYIKNTIRICNLIRECGISDESVLIDVTW